MKVGQRSTLKCDLELGFGVANCAVWCPSADLSTGRGARWHMLTLEGTLAHLLQARQATLELKLQALALMNLIKEPPAR